jgi:hypothetical protein
MLAVASEMMASARNLYMRFILNAFSVTTYRLDDVDPPREDPPPLLLPENEPRELLIEPPR